jgi:hypothetical protein
MLSQGTNPSAYTWQEYVAESLRKVRSGEFNLFFFPRQLLLKWENDGGLDGLGM